MIITIDNENPQAGEKDWRINIVGAVSNIMEGTNGDVDHYTVGEAIAKLREIEAMMLAATPSGENNSG